MKLPKIQIKKFLTGSMVLGAATVGIVLPASAANLSNVKVTLSDTQRSASATHTFQFKAATTGSIKCIRVAYSSNARTFAQGDKPGGMSTTSVARPITTKLDTSNPPTTAVTNEYTAAVDGAGDGAFTFTNATGNTATGGSSFVQITASAIVNPSAAGTYFARVSTYNNTDCSSNALDSAVVAFSVQDGTLVSITVDPTLTLTIGGVAAGSQIKGAINASASCSASSSAVTFPTLTIDTDYQCGQTISVASNAANGYTLYLRGDQGGTNFLRTGYSEITNWTGTNGSPTAWPTTNDSEAFGYTTTDDSLGTGTANRFNATDTWAAVTTTASEILYNANPGTENQKVGYRIRIAGSTKAGAYSGTIVYTAVPTF